MFAMSKLLSIACPSRARTMAAIAVICASGLFPIRAFGQGAAAKDAAKLAQEARAKEMVALADDVHVFEESAEGKRVELKRLEEPVLRFNDQASPFKFRDGTLWVFADEGRPRMLLSLERYDDTWGHELVSLSETPSISAKTKHGWDWESPEPGLVFKTFPEQPKMAESPAALLRQHKALARGFDVGEIGSVDGDDYQLRLMPTPIHTYESPEAGVLSGGIYIFAYGTNPEVLMVIEAKESADKSRSWQYAFSLLTAATPTARLNGREVWSAPRRGTGQTQTPYTHYSYAAPLLGTDDQ